ncbi:MAG: ribonuclease III [Myxococcota bacterium]|nr:ribonuclease III [Myxococcota bacterium]
MSGPNVEALQMVEKHLGYVFSDESLLMQALTHKSFSNEHHAVHADNQRLEFLGDAVLGLAVAEALMTAIPTAAEGQLTPRRAALVCEASLADLARRVGLGEMVLLGRGEEMNNGRDRPSILADAVEALIGAVQLDGGYEAARDVVLQWLGSTLDEVAAASERPDDVKTALQEALQAENREMPSYCVVGEEGPGHSKVFEVEISVAGQCLARGRGRSKKDAEKDAAKQALAALEAE